MITSSAMLPDCYRNGKLISHKEIFGIPTTVIDVPYSNYMSYSERILSFARFAILSSWEAMRCRGDVVFATSTPLTIAIPGILSSWWQRIPLVFEVRDLWPDLPISVGALRNPLSKFLARKLELLAYRASSRVIALSPGMAEGVIRQGTPEGKIAVIPNSCDVDIFNVPASQGMYVRSKLKGVSDKSPLVVYAGTFGRINGIEYLVKVAAAMQKISPDVCFLLVGSGAQKAAVAAKAASMGVLERNMWIWEPLPKSEMPSVMSAATVVTSIFAPLKSMWNNSANKFFDALAAGKPVAINYEGWQAELLNNSGAGIVIPQANHVVAAELLASFVHDRSKLQKASAAARDLARTRFNRDLLAKQFEMVLQQAVSGRKYPIDTCIGRRPERPS